MNHTPSLCLQENYFLHVRRVLAHVLRQIYIHRVAPLRPKVATYSSSFSSSESISLITCGIRPFFSIFLFF
eukprot:UN01371